MAELLLIVFFLMVLCGAPVLAICIIATNEINRRNRPTKSREAE